MRRPAVWFLASWATVSSFGGVLAQQQKPSFPVAEVQNNTFNATHGPYNPETARARIAQANLSADHAEAVLTALNYERSNWAGTSVRLDPFYTELPANWSSAPAGTVLKVEHNTNTSLYTVAPTTALSRLLFVSRTFNGTAVPASAYVLWPWLPRHFDADGDDPGSNLPIITWGHGTSGWSGECGPSHIRNLWYQFMIFTAATQGYVVVAPDYAGLGLDHDGAGNFIPHQYLASRAGGQDLLYAVQAAREAWPVELGDSRYVVMGHSQGGGAAWGAATVLASNSSSNGTEKNNVDDDIAALRHGYLGTVAGSPWMSLGTSLRFQPSAASLQSLVARIATGVRSVFAEFELQDWLTEKGVRVVSLMQDLQGCQAVAAELLGSTADLVRPDWNQSSWYANAFINLTSNVGQPFAGPLLVLQGTGDAAVNATGVDEAVDAACAAVPGESVELVEFAGVGHTPAMFSGQQIWLDWIADRFAGREAPAGCRKRQLQPLRDSEAYQFDRNWYLEWNQYSYGVA